MIHIIYNHLIEESSVQNPIRLEESHRKCFDRVPPSTIFSHKEGRREKERERFTKGHQGIPFSEAFKKRSLPRPSSSIKIDGVGADYKAVWCQQPISSTHRPT
jgi:hypothetical protein